MDRNELITGQCAYCMRPVAAPRTSISNDGLYFTIIGNVIFNENPGGSKPRCICEANSVTELHDSA